MNRAADALNRAMRTTIDWPSVGLSIVPGVPQIRAGARRLGFTLLGLWVGLLLVALFWAGSGFGWFLLACAVGLHSSVATLPFAQALQYSSLPRRMLFGLVVYAILIAVVYVPIRWTATNLADVVVVTGMRRSLLVEDGDAVVYSGPWTSPAAYKRGDVVVYDLVAAYNPGVATRGGIAIDRIIGVEGDLVAVRDSAVFVNGVRVSGDRAPLTTFDSVGEGFEYKVSPGRYAIIPSTTPMLQHGRPLESLRARLLQSVIGVGADGIRGQALFRLRPLPRIGTFREVTETNSRAGKEQGG
ncbi:MAG: S26 family signal peptidase [Phycisphaerales bacterium]